VVVAVVVVMVVMVMLMLSTLHWHPTRPPTDATLNQQR
jgi:hypothetical protein